MLQTDKLELNRSDVTILIVAVDLALKAIEAEYPAGGKEFLKLRQLQDRLMKHVKV